jgi:hypothetical protein
MWKEGNSIDYAVVNHAEGLEVILEPMSNDDRVLIDERA